MTEPGETHCRVCGGNATRDFLLADGYGYRRCPDCAATMMSAAFLPAPEIERRHYTLHENNPEPPSSRRFLGRLAEPLLERLPAASSGLDYGCGPGPALARMLKGAGHAVRLYDPFFRADEAALREEYDFIACSEVVEHFHRPKEEFARLDGMLKAGGWLGIMTCFQTDDGRFADWHYRRDPTHVVFYREETFRFLARAHGWHCEIPARNVVLMRKDG